MANELQVILDEIVIDKEGNLLPSNLRKGVTALGVKGTFEGGGTGKGEVQLFETIEEMNSNPGELDDKAMVYKKSVKNAVQSSIFSSFVAPTQVVLPNAITSENFEIYMSAVEASGWADCQGNLSKTSMSLSFYTESTNWYIQYSSTDGITYNRTDTKGNPMDFGQDMKFETWVEFDSRIGNFMQLENHKFNGVFAFGKTKDKLKVDGLLVNKEKTTFILPAFPLEWFDESVIKPETDGGAFQVLPTKVIDGKIISGTIYTGYSPMPVLHNGKAYVAEGSHSGGTDTDKKCQKIVFDFDEANPLVSNEIITTATVKQGTFIGDNLSGGSGWKYYLITPANDIGVVVTRYGWVKNAKFNRTDAYYYDLASIPASGSQSKSITNVEYMKEVWLPLPTQFNALANDILPDKMALGATGEIIGSDAIYSNLDPVKIKADTIEWFAAAEAMTDKKGFRLVSTGLPEQGKNTLIDIETLPTRFTTRVYKDLPGRKGLFMKAFENEPDFIEAMLAGTSSVYPSQIDGKIMGCAVKYNGIYYCILHTSDTFEIVDSYKVTDADSTMQLMFVDKNAIYLKKFSSSVFYTKRIDRNTGAVTSLQLTVPSTLFNSSIGEVYQTVKVKDNVLMPMDWQSAFTVLCNFDTSVIRLLGATSATTAKAQVDLRTSLNEKYILLSDISATSGSITVYNAVYDVANNTAAYSTYSVTGVSASQASSYSKYNIRSMLTDGSLFLPRIFKLSNGTTRIDKLVVNNAGVLANTNVITNVVPRSPSTTHFTREYMLLDESQLGQYIGTVISLLDGSIIHRPEGSFWQNTDNLMAHGAQYNIFLYDDYMYPSEYSYSGTDDKIIPWRKALQLFGMAEGGTGIASVKRYGHSEYENDYTGTLVAMRIED